MDVVIMNTKPTIIPVMTNYALLVTNKDKFHVFNTNTKINSTVY